MPARGCGGQDHARIEHRTTFESREAASDGLHFVTKPSQEERQHVRRVDVVIHDEDPARRGNATRAIDDRSIGCAQYVHFP